MSGSYPTYEAKARFSEILRMVREGRTVRISWHGRDVAEIRPLPPDPSTGERVAGLEERGLLVGGRERRGRLEPVARRKGALARFLAERE
jgi:prevent-host-death family protein